MWRFLEKLEIELPYDPAIPLLSIHTEETKRERDTCPGYYKQCCVVLSGLCQITSLPFRRERRYFHPTSEGKKKFNALAWISVNIQDLNKEAFHFHDHFSKVSFSLGKTAKNLTVFLEYIIRTMFTIWDMILLLLLSQHLPPCSYMLMTMYLPHTTKEAKNFKSTAAHWGSKLFNIQCN